nr:putative pectinesterase 67 [Quercus suber]
MPPSAWPSSALPIAFAITCVISIYFSNPVHGLDAQTVIDSPLLTKKIGTNRTIKVDINGDGDFRSVQAAINSVPEGNAHWTIIHVRKGVYREKVHIPVNKPYIFLRGNGKGRTAIVWSESSSNNVESAVLRAEAPHFIAFGVSFKNDAPTGIASTSQNQSVAAFVGSVDFIFGRGRSVFHSCEIFVIGDKRVKIRGSVTAQNRESENDYSGFVFVKGKVYGVGSVYLGRAKGPHSRVLFAKTYLSKTIAPQGWTNWSYDGSTENLFHAEYKCHGPGSESKERAAWSRELTEEEVAPFLSIDYIDGTHWLPVWL